MFPLLLNEFIFIFNVQIIFSSVRVAEWPPLGKELLTRLAVYVIVIQFFSHFGFEDRTLVLSVPEFLAIACFLLF